VEPRIVTDTHLDELPKEEVASGVSFAPRGTQEDLTFLDFLIIVTQRKKFVALATALGFLFALLVAFRLPVEYTATVVVLPPRGSTSIEAEPVNPPADQKSSVGKEKVVPARRDLNDLYVSILRSRAVEDSVIQRFGLMAAYRRSSQAAARTTLEKNTKIDGSSRDGLIRLSFSDRDPIRASEIANGYIEQFRALSQHLVIPEAVRDGFFIQVVDPAEPPEQKSSPNRVRITMAGAVLGLTIGIMLVLLQGGLVRMQRNPATKAKLELLKRSASLRQPTVRSDGADVTELRPRHEATG
jgi:uncharacterized protein involved in exopolysaccharide biosynthesis